MRQTSYRSNTRPARPLSPPLRAPSPLGGMSWVALHEGMVVPLPPYRPSTAPPVAPIQQQRVCPPSPPLRPPLLVAQSISRQELQKINCDELQFRLGNVLNEFQRLAIALRAIQNKISRSWTVPQRAVRGQMRTIVQQFATNATYLSKYLSAMAIASRQILHFIATCIRETHGLKDFAHVQDLKPVIDELRLLHSQWAALTRAGEKFGELLSSATLIFEEAMDPDHWTPASPLSEEITSLASAHHSLTRAFSNVATFLHDLAIADWQPPLLSPNDVKIAASQWRDVERVGGSSAKEVRSSVKNVLEGSVVCAFVAREDAERIWKMFGEGVMTSTVQPRPYAPPQSAASPHPNEIGATGVAPPAGGIGTDYSTSSSIELGSVQGQATTAEQSLSGSPENSQGSSEGMILRPMTTMSYH